MVDGVSLRDRRQQLLAQPGIRGADLCAVLAREADLWLAHLCQRAAGGRQDGVALLAVGGYGRRELCPYSDLDLVLVHGGRRGVAAIAEAIWYPVWDDGLTLDHSVRRRDEVLGAAEADLRVALGLLEGRAVWGEPALAGGVLETVRHQWQSSLGARWLPPLAEQIAARWDRHGDVAFLLEPDLKQGRGGLRDARALHAMASAAPGLADAVDLDGVDRAARILLAARVELHRGAGRNLDRLVLQEQDQVAAALGYDDADALMADVAAAGRTIAWACEDALRRRHRWVPDASGLGGSGRSRLRRRGRDGAAEVECAGTPSTAITGTGIPGAWIAGPGITARAGEITVDLETPRAQGPALALQLAAAASETQLPVAPGALHQLAADPAPVPDPWTRDMREALVRVLSTGSHGVKAMEALDQVGLLVHVLPEWSLVRNKPQRNAYHRFTVDRHLLEAAAEGAAIAAHVDRPDLLLVGCLLHDIGKGMPGDHTDAGVVLVDRIGRRMGFPAGDVHVLVQLCRHHLLLPDVATRRDLDDPATVTAVADAVGSPRLLRLLAALTEADARATGTAAWGPWKAALVADLVERVERRLVGEPAPAPAPHPAAVHGNLVSAVRADGRPAVRVAPPRLVVAALDRRGLLAAVAGTLAVHGLDVRQADASSIEGVAVEEFVVETPRDRWPSGDDLLRDLGAVLAGRMDLDARLAERAAQYATARRPRIARAVRPVVTIDLAASVASTVVDVHAADTTGLLHRLAATLARMELDVVSARVSTVGELVVDAFYVRDATGHKVTEPGLLEAIEQQMLATVSQR